MSEYGQQITRLYMRWNEILNKWTLCIATDRNAVEFERVMPKPKYFNVTLEVFDGQQYGLMTLCVEALNEDQAGLKAVQSASYDGWQRIKIQFSRPG